MVAAAVGVGSAVAGVAGANAQSNAAQAANQNQTEFAVYSAINQQANLNNMLALLRPTSMQARRQWANSATSLA